MPKNNLNNPIFKDQRGEIRRFNIKGIKFNLVFTKPKIYRGGESHPNWQYILNLKGKIEIKMKFPNKELTIKPKKNELISIPPHIPHIMKSLTNSIMMEWWSGPFQCKYYPPYRKLVK